MQRVLRCLYATVVLRMPDHVREELCSSVTGDFREDSKNRYIPRISRDFFRSLTFKGNADQLRPQPVSTAGQESERTIEVATPHAHTVPFSIEYDERSDNNVKLVRVDQRT